MIKETIFLLRGHVYHHSHGNPCEGCRFGDLLRFAAPFEAFNYCREALIVGEGTVQIIFLTEKPPPVPLTFEYNKFFIKIKPITHGKENNE